MRGWQVCNRDKSCTENHLHAYCKLQLVIGNGFIIQCSRCYEGDVAVTVHGEQIRVRSVEICWIRVTRKLKTIEIYEYFIPL